MYLFIRLFIFHLYNIYLFTPTLVYLIVCWRRLLIDIR